MKWIIIFLLLPFISFADTNTITGTTTIDKQKSPPPSAISPSISIIQSDICKYSMSGAVSTQILGISTGVAIEDLNCERIKLSRMLFQQNLRIASVAILCEDPRVFTAMANAGTWCPAYDPKTGKSVIGEDAKAYWLEHKERRPDYEYIKNDQKIIQWGALFSALGLLLLL
jgi:hypothetical protein